ncbi:MAG: hypothetical protein GEV05_23900 [Betaproteobacteria bacterium]|nr:hypothetical protein [Betaproteobacteria bacterium]
MARYLVPSEYAKRSILPNQIATRFHSQIFRNVVFACKMAGDVPWHVVNLVSSTQSRADERHHSFTDPTGDVRHYLHADRQHCFTYRTWEDMHTKLIQHDSELSDLDCYLRGKSAHYLPAFQLE